MKKSGFTLIELIVTLVLGAFAMAAVVPLLGPVFLGSGEGPALLQAGLALQSAMEDLSSRQVDEDLEALRTRVGSEGGSYLGRFPVVHNRYIAFGGGVESSVPATNVLLKITLQSPVTGEQLTRIFGRER